MHSAKSERALSLELAKIISSWNCVLLLENQFPQDFKMISHGLILHACISKYDEINGRVHNAVHHAG